MNQYWKRIRLAMENNNINSWYELSKVTKVSEQTLSSTRVRNGYLSFENTCKIAYALNLSLDELNVIRGDDV